VLLISRQNLLAESAVVSFTAATTTTTTTTTSSSSSSRPLSSPSTVSYIYQKTTQLPAVYHANV